MPSDLRSLATDRVPCADTPQKTDTVARVNPAPGDPYVTLAVVHDDGLTTQQMDIVRQDDRLRLVEVLPQAGDRVVATYRFFERDADI